ncbi:MAG TPA: class I SAM-dependent methyltransferase [Solirubrobacteraceae bacterium]|nr:class I SAM-dependent methyltransferase [Solirubrobacteraceae bacterium]
MSNGDGPAAARWRRLVGDRLAELERLSPAAGSVSGSFWDSRADRYAAAVRRANTERDPFLRRLRRLTDASSTVIDVGAGTGRFALVLADGVGHVTAVEPSSAMLAILERDAQELGTTNVTAVQASWDEARVEPADVAFSAFVLTLVPDAVPFLAKLDATARHHALLYLGAYSGDAVLDPLWRHFHGAPRVPGPSYLDAVAVLRELGIEHRVRVVEIPDHRRWATVEDAVESYRDALLLDDTAHVRAELANLLASWLLGRRGAYRSPLRVVPAAIVDWTGGQLAER